MWMAPAGSCARGVAWALLLALGWTAPLAGQSVRGRLLEPPGEQPAAGAIAILEDAAGAEVARGVTSASGGFVLTAPAPGRYRLRVLRIGFPAWQSHPIALAAGQREVLRLLLPGQRIVLPTLTVTAEDPGCRAIPDGLETATLFEEVRKALSLTAWTVRQRRFDFRTRIVDRRLDMRLHPITADTAETDGLLSWPVRSLPPDSLATGGYVRNLDTRGDGPIYYGPDTDVLVSNSFLGQHCFRLRPPSDPADSGLVGLAFTTAPGVRRPNIAGVLWLDRTTVELRYLEYRYTGLRDWVGEGDAGGRIDFARLPGGAWIIRRWMVRAGVAGINPAFRRPRLAGFVERVGQVTEVRDRNGTVITTYGAP